jgi:sugar lactone lactonase YvrE
MRARIGAVVAAAATLAWIGVAAADGIEVVAKDVRFPEGPLWSDGALLFVEYGGHTILRLGADGGLTTIWERPGCGPAALVQAGRDLLVTCYDENTLVLVSAAGETLRVGAGGLGAAF